MEYSYDFETTCLNCNAVIPHYKQTCGDMGFCMNAPIIEERQALSHIQCRVAEESNDVYVNGNEEPVCLDTSRPLKEGLQNLVLDNFKKMRFKKWVQVTVDNNKTPRKLLPYKMEFKENLMLVMYCTDYNTREPVEVWIPDDIYFFMIEDHEGDMLCRVERTPQSIKQKRQQSKRRRSKY